MRGRLLVARGITLGVAVFIALAYFVVQNPFDPSRFGADTQAYWDAAVRIRHGLPVYPVLTDVDASSVFRYPAWFAYAWVPLTALPERAVDIGWAVLLSASSVVAVQPSLRTRTAAGIALAALMIPFLLEAAWLGNVEPLLVAALVLGIGSRAEPVAIGLAAATKLAPIVFVAIPLARRDVRGAVVAVLVMTVLVVPGLAFGIAGYPSDIGGTLYPWESAPWLWAVGAGAAVAWMAVAAWRRSPLVAVAAALASIALPPRVNLLLMPRLLPAVHWHTVGRGDAVMPTEPDATRS